MTGLGLLLRAALLRGPHQLAGTTAAAVQGTTAWRTRHHSGPIDDKTWPAGYTDAHGWPCKPLLQPRVTIAARSYHNSARACGPSEGQNTPAQQQQMPTSGSAGSLPQRRQQRSPGIVARLMKLLPGVCRAGISGISVAVAGLECRMC